jgi:hypothetical protein
MTITFLSPDTTISEVDRLVKDLKALKDEKEELEMSLKGLNISIESLQERITQEMLAHGKTSWHIPGLAKIGISERAFPKLSKDPNDVRAFLEWCKAKGDDFYFTHVSMHSQTLARVVKEETEQNGEANIPGVDSSFKKKILSFRKG